MKLIYPLIFLLIFKVQVNAQNFEWSKLLGSRAGGQGLDIAVDALGNVYSVGSFGVLPSIWVNGGPADFNPGPGVFNFNVSGAYISKLDNQGNFVWAKNLPVTISNSIQVGSTRLDRIEVDNFGDIVVTGFCSGNADLDPGLGVYTLPEAGPFMEIGSVFVAKYTAGGNFVWAKVFPGNELNGSVIKIDSQNNILIGITYSGTIDANPGTDTLSYTAGGLVNALVVKLNSNGNLIWDKNIYGNQIFLSSLTCDTDDRIYLVGVFGFAYFNGQLLPPSISSNQFDGYILKLASNGNFEWLKTIAGTKYDLVTDVTSDGDGNIYCTGAFQDTARFGDANDSLVILASGTGQGFNSSNNDGFTAKLDSTGHFQWVKSFGNADSTFGMGGRKIRVDSIGNVYTLASIKGNVLFNRSYENVAVNAVGEYSLALIKHNKNGEVIRVQKADGDKFVLGNGLALDNSGNIFFTGIINVVNDFFNLVGTGGIDMDPGIDTALAIGAGNGVDGIFITKWSQCNTDTSISYQALCNTYNWNNEVYNTSGTYTKRLTNAAGCDSIAKLNLTILVPSTVAQNINLCAGDSIIINNQTYNQSGFYQDTLTAINGCDSIVTTHLFVDTLQAQIVDFGLALQAVNFPVNASIQWLDCTNNFNLLLGDTNQIFTPIINGSYAVIVTQNGCSDTSNCLQIITVGLESSPASNFTIQPNPANEYISILSKQKKQTMSIFNSKGQQVYNAEFIQPTTEISVKNWANGVYILKIGTTFSKLIIQHE